MDPENWQVEDVQKWLTKQKVGNEVAAAFEGMDGQEMLALTKDVFYHGKKIHLGNLFLFSPPSVDVDEEWPPPTRALKPMCAHTATNHAVTVVCTNPFLTFSPLFSYVYGTLQ